MANHYTIHFVDKYGNPQWKGNFMRLDDHGIYSEAVARSVAAQLRKDGITEVVIKREGQVLD